MQAEVHFSPSGGCEAAVVKAIGGAKHEVLVMAYAFTSRPILDALRAVKLRGVDVRAVLDYRANLEKGSLDHEMASFAEVRTDKQHPIMHDKVMVIDEQVVVTGSFNFTNAAEHRNAENLLILDCKTGGPLRYLPGKYRDNWLLHWDHSEPWVAHAYVLGGDLSVPLADF